MPAVARGELDRGIMDEKTSRALLAARSPPLTRPPRYQVALGNALRSEVLLHMEGVSAGGSGCAPELPSAPYRASAVRQYNCRNKCVPKCKLATRGRTSFEVLPAFL